MSKEVQITLTEDEAWVLFEFTRRFSDTDKLGIEDQAEERALWNLCCVFEKALHQDSDLKYTDFIAACRNRLRDEE
ncbi:hypothetical protein L4174_009650 [Photobacterium sp. CCB-ST2H9]|uniref:hypothetical protein n=1 Tax=Photobacterium sp. CCB-ST2H9 TaxID=2912855 RepID=UPI002005E59A|nr:hypothetical protein [Photobacterium sp. CCB-ST2H9]UTM56112.1 hypothetical protein L4174_009650 [Photobacterium sp. CCB-ST2H9]